MSAWETTAIVSTVIIAAWFYRSRRRMKSSCECSVSKAHLTCDPGDEYTGYNNVVATVRFCSTINSATFFDAFKTSMIGTDESNMWSKRMRFVNGYMVWDSLGSPEWSPNDHLLVHSESVSETDIEEIVAKFISSPISLSRPCWEMMFLERVKSEGRVFSVCIFKYHHALADGFTMLRHMLLRTFPADGSPLQTGLDLLPGFTRKPPIQSNHTVFSVCRSLISVLGQRRDPPSTFRASTPRKPNERIIVAFSDLPGVTVKRLKGITESLRLNLGKHVSLNDILVSALSIAMRDFDTCERNTTNVQDATSVIWVSLPRNAETEKLESGNAGLGFASCALPLSIDTHDSVLATVLETQKRLSALKASAEPAVINMALYLIGSLPVWLGKRISVVAADSASASISNMAGPTQKLVWPVPHPDSRQSETYPGAAEVESVYFATSPPFHYGPLFSLLTYHGNVYISVSARAELFSQEELSKLVKFYLLNAVIKIEKSIQ